MLTTAVLLVLAAAPSPKPTTATAVPADGRIAMPEGIRFRLPAGFAYRVEATETGRTYVAESREQSGVVAVTAVRSDTELPCEPPREGASVRAHRTAPGLRACVVSGNAADGPGAMTLAFVKGGEVLVTIIAATTSASADDLATAVADSVEIDVRGPPRTNLPVAKVPRADARLVGCFEQSFGMSFGRGFTRAWWKRCFREDLTFTETSSVGTMTEHTDAVYGDHLGTSTATGEGGERRGTWLYADGVLTMVYEDGAEAEWEIGFSDASENVLASGKLWERIAE